MSQPLNTCTDGGTLQATQICFWASGLVTEQSNCHCTRSWMQSECQTGFKPPLNLIALEYLLKRFPFLFFSATLTLSFSPTGNHLASLWMNWFWASNSLLHYREKILQKLSAKHPDSQLMRNFKCQWSNPFLMFVRLHVLIRLFILINAGSICNLFRAQHQKFVDKVVQINTPCTLFHGFGGFFLCFGGGFDIS